MVLTDELCDYWLSATAREKSRGLEIDISFAVCNEHGLSQMYRQYSRALVLSVTLEAGGRPLLLLGILKREGRGCGRRRGFDARQTEAGQSPAFCPGKPRDSAAFSSVPWLTSGVGLLQ